VTQIKPSIMPPRYGAGLIQGSPSINKKHSCRSETALARKQLKKDGWKLNSRRKRKNKFVTNVPKLLLEVALSHQFLFPTIISQLFGVNESDVFGM
jgi:hypothetical protein